MVLAPLNRSLNWKQDLESSQSRELETSTQPTHYTWFLNPSVHNPAGYEKLTQEYRLSEGGPCALGTAGKVLPRNSELQAFSRTGGGWVYVTLISPSYNIIIKSAAKLVCEDFHNEATRDCQEQNKSHYTPTCHQPANAWGNSPQRGKIRQQKEKQNPSHRISDNRMAIMKENGKVCWTLSKRKMNPISKREQEPI